MEKNSGEVFTVPQDGYGEAHSNSYGFLRLCGNHISWLSSCSIKEELRNSKRGAAIPHLNKELFYNLLIGIPPLAEQQRIAERVNELSQLLK